jgi:hypothetical protein
MGSLFLSGGDSGEFTLNPLALKTEKDRKPEENMGEKV